jgi:hypothetical protein
MGVLIRFPGGLESAALARRAPREYGAPDAEISGAVSDLNRADVVCALDGPHIRHAAHAGITAALGRHGRYPCCHSGYCDEPPRRSAYSRPKDREAGPVCTTHTALAPRLARACAWCGDVLLRTSVAIYGRRGLGRCTGCRRDAANPFGTGTSTARDGVAHKVPVQGSPNGSAGARGLGHDPQQCEWHDVPWRRAHQAPDDQAPSRGLASARDVCDGRHELLAPPADRSLVVYQAIRVTTRSQAFRV